MTFSTIETLRRRLSRAAPSSRSFFATIEVGHEDFKSGLMIKIDALKDRPHLELVIMEAMELAAVRLGRARRLNDPGWWVGVLCQAAGEAGFAASVMRGRAERSRNHACVIVPHGGIIDARADFPLVRIGLAPHLRDLRGERATALGPTDGDLLRYAKRQGVDAKLSVLRMAFDTGVLGWSSRRDREGRVMIDAAGMD